MNQAAEMQRAEVPRVYREDKLSGGRKSDPFNRLLQIDPPDCTVPAYSEGLESGIGGSVFRVDDARLAQMPTGANSSILSR